jgi:hypothetical protein
MQQNLPNPDAWAHICAQAAFEKNIRPEQFRGAPTDGGRDIEQSRHNDLVKATLTHLWEEYDNDPLEVKEWLKNYRTYRTEHTLFCTYNNVRYRCIGRNHNNMKIVWLVPPLGAQAIFPELRVPSSACTDWQIL